MSACGKKGRTSIDALGPDGSRTPVDGTGVVATLGDGRELRVTFSRHPMSDGGVVLRSGFVPPGTSYRPPVPGRAPEAHARMTLHPGGGNVLRVGIEAFSGGPGGLRIEETAAAPRPALFTESGEARSLLASRTVVLTLGNGADLILGVGRAPGEGPAAPGDGVPDLGPSHQVALHAGLFPTSEEVERMMGGGPIRSSTLRVGFGAANVVHVTVEREGEVRALRNVGDAVDLWLTSWTREGLRERIEESAAALGPDVLEALVERLSAGEPRVREGARDLLVLLTGQDFPGPAEAGEAGALQWKRWWGGSKGRLAFDPATRRFISG